MQASSWAGWPNASVGWLGLPMTFAATPVLHRHERGVFLA